MKILHIVPSLEESWGGPAKSVPALCRSLVQAGHSVTIFTTNWAHQGINKLAQPKKDERDGIKVLTFPVKPFFLDSHIPYAPGLLDSLKNTAQQFDVSHFHVLWNPVVSFGMQILRQKKLPYLVAPRGTMDPVVLRHNSWKKVPWAALWEKANLKNAFCVHFTASAEETKARQSGWRLHQTVIAPNLIELAEWRADSGQETAKIFPVPYHHKIIFFAGRINWVKNLDLLIKALALLRQANPNVSLVCAGPDNDGTRIKLEKLIQDLKLQKNVIFTGMLDKKNLQAAYAGADVFALVSQRENFGMAAAEALACGLPLVLSDGVDMDLPASRLVARVTQNPSAIAEALARQLALERTSELIAEARSLVANCVSNAILPLLDIYQKAAARNY